jgi:hypothetical protein
MALKVKISEFVSASFVSGSDLIPIVRYESGSYSNKKTDLSAVKDWLVTSVPIGIPADGVYTDGFFDTFTNTTRISDAIDDISEAFLDLAPVKAGLLTGTNLSISGVTEYSAYLASGLNSHWYSGSISAGSQVSKFVNGTALTLSTTGSGQSSPMNFRSGKYSDFSSLTGGVTASFSTGSNAVVQASSASILNSTASVVSSSLAIGTGILPSTYINGTSRYNTFWTQTSASVKHTLSVTGSSTYRVTADNGAGTTNGYTIWFATNTGNDYPNQTVSATASVSTVNLKYISGMAYLSGSSTVQVRLNANNLHNPVYNSTPISFAFSNPTIGSISATGSTSTPAHGDQLAITTSLNVTTANQVSSTPWTTNPTFVVTATKPGKSNVTSGTVTVYSRPVNTYSNPSSGTTNAANTITELFLDEYYRIGNLKSGSTSTYTTNFPSSSNLQTSVSSADNAHLQVQNGRLIAAGSGDYSGFTPGASAGGYANYFRRLDILSDNVESGQLTMSFSGFSTVEAWGSSTGVGPEVAIVLSSSIASNLTASSIFDLGLGTGLYSGTNVTGSQNAANSSLGSGRVYWALPLGTNTGPATTNHLVLWIRYKNASTNYIDDLTFKV